MHTPGSAVRGQATFASPRARSHLLLLSKQQTHWLLLSVQSSVECSQTTAVASAKCPQLARLRTLAQLRP
jgi:hypothetical protein